MPGIFDNREYDLANPGIGLASPEAPEVDLSAQNDIGKLGTVLREFGAGVLGKPSPLAQMQAQQRQNKLLKLAELKTGLGLMDDGLKSIEGLEGPERELAVERLAGQMGKIEPGLAEAFRSVTKRPDISEYLRKNGADLPPFMLDVARRSPKEFYKLIATAEGQKLIEKQADSKALNATGNASLIGKARFLIGVLPTLVPEMHQRFMKNGRLDPAELDEAMEFVSQNPEQKALAWTPTERAVVRRNHVEVYTALDMQTPEKVQETEAARIKEEEKPKEKTPHVTEVGIGDDQFQKASVTIGEDGKPVVELVGKPYKKKDGVTVSMPGFAQLVTRDGVPGLLRVGKDGKEEFIPNVTPSPKEKDPIKEAIAAAIAGAGKQAAKNPAVAAVDAAKKSEKPVSALPPEIIAKLKTGVNTTLSDGSVWTLVNGKPKKVR